MALYAVIGIDIWIEFLIRLTGLSLCAAFQTADQRNFGWINPAGGAARPPQVRITHRPQLQAATRH